MNDFVQKVENWVQKRVISVRSAKRILAAEGYNSEEVLHVSSTGRAISVIATLGSLLVGLGVILFFASNWSEISVPFKVALIVLATITAYGIGYYLKYVKGTFPRVGAAVIFLGGLFYGSGLFLVSQIFHTNANPSTLFFIWAVGLLPIVLFLKHEALYSLVTVVLAFWTSFVTFGGGSLFWGNREFSANYYFLLVWVLMLGLAIKLKFIKGYTLTFFSIFYWVWLAIVAYLANTNTYEEQIIIVGMLLYLLLGIVSVFAGRLLEKHTLLEPFGFPTRALGGFVVAAAIYGLSFNFVLWEFGGELVLTGGFLWVFYGLLTAVVVLGTLQFLKIDTPEQRRLYTRESGILLLVTILAVIFYWLPVSHDVTPSYFYDINMHPYMIPWNMALLAVNVLFILVGYLERRQSVINVSLLLFVVHVITRYFDTLALYFEGYSTFIVGGILLIALAVALERFRRKLISKIKETPETPSLSPQVPGSQA